MRILIIEHDDTLRHTLEKLLVAESFTVETAGGAEDGLAMCLDNGYDLILLENALPGASGLALCRELRRNAIPAPVLLLSPASLAQDKAALLDAGIDDYLAKPCDLEELRFRVRSLLRRPRVVVPGLLKVADLVLDPAEQRVRRGRREIYLTRKEFALAEYLMRRGGAVAGRIEILQHVWHSGIDWHSNTIEAHILNLRRKIDHGEKRKLIHTVSGRGYKIAAPDKAIFT
jgi:DNA-binding response OmpR family regulator